MENINWNIVGENKTKIKFVVPIGKKKMKNVINISAQQQQQQSSREDGPSVA